ncbi:MAG: RNA polymerase sigma factor [Phycisphaerales bacterium JB039]
MDPVQAIEDELLVLRAQGQDREALGELVGRWHGRLLRHARLLTGDSAGAADVTQEAWVGIVRGLRRLDDPARFGPWAYRIVTRRAADWTAGRQRERRLVRAATELGRQSEAAPDSRADEIAQLRQALRALPGDRRAMLALLYLDGASVSLISLIFQIPPGTVKSRLHHARRELRQTIERMNNVEHR